MKKQHTEEENVAEQEEPPKAAPHEAAPCPSCEEYKLGWQRALADYDNLQKNIGRERTEMRASVRESFVESLLPVVDNFDQAVKFVPQDLPESAKGWLQGVLYVQQQFTDALSNLGAEPYGSPGEIFDPHLHAASGEQTVEGKNPGEIIEVLQRGWKMGGRVIRPASVIIQANS